MATVFTTGMQGPKAVEQLNELWEVASNAADGVVKISTDPDNVITLGSDLGITHSARRAKESNKFINFLISKLGRDRAPCLTVSV